jgi:glucan exporter ATP-binding protein
VVELYLRVIGLLRPVKTLAIALLATNLALAVVNFLEPWLLGQIIDGLSRSDNAMAGVNIARWAVVGFGGVAVGVWISLHAERLAHKRRLDLIAEYFERAIQLPLAFHQAHHTGRLLRIMLEGTGSLFQIWLGFFRTHLVTLLSMLIMLPVAIIINVKLGLLMLILLASFAVLNSLTMKRTHLAQSHVEELHQRIAERAGDVLRNVSVIQSFVRVTDESESIRDLTQRVLAAQYPVLRGWAWLSVGNRAASVMTISAVFALGVSLHRRGEVSVGQIVSVVGFSLALIGRMEQMTTFITSLFSQSPSLRAFFGILDAAVNDSSPRLYPQLNNVRGDVVFEDVTFGYAPEYPVLKKIKFHIPAGSVVALVGPTGAGKTTALSLLCGGRELDEGRILIDGNDIQFVDRDSLRRNIAVVFQDAGLLYRTIAENLLIGNPNATEKDLIVAARVAEAHNFIMSQSLGYSTTVTESGHSLSGGECQRIAIARALLKDAPILLMDEATSALDTATDMRVQHAVRALMNGRTTFIVAHRLSTVRDADKILVFQKGEIVEQGVYEDLSRGRGLFAELEQNGRFVVGA